MSYIHKKTFDIIEGVDCLNNPYDFFEVDELIAMPIQALNRKGYITQWCCAGHPFENSIDWANANLPEDFRNTIGSLRLNTRTSYIIFEEGFFLPELPPEFVIMKGFAQTDKRLKIERYYDTNDHHEFLRNVLESMEQLYLWITNLPNFKN